MPSPAEKPVSKQRRYLVNALWNATSGFVSILAALILSPYVIRKLGAEAYGIYALVFSLTSYYGMADLGLRSATLFYSAKYRAEGRIDRVSDMISTLLVYFTGVAVVLSLITVGASAVGPGLFRVMPHQRETFRIVVLLIGLPISLGIPAGIFHGLLLGYQRFDLANQVASASHVARNLGFVAVLFLGFGLEAMGVIYCLVVVLGNLVIYILARREVQGLVISYRRSSWTTFRESASYGLQNFLGGIAIQAVDQGPPLVVGLKQSIMELGYFSLPTRLITYAVETVLRLGNVALPQAAEFHSQGRQETVRDVVIYSNRYILALFMPLLIGFTVYGREVLRMWVNPEFAERGVWILLVSVWTYGLVHASQSATNSVLQAIGRQKQWLIVNLGEALLLLAGLPWLVSRYGSLGAAAWTGALLVVGHGIGLPLILCQSLDMSLWVYYRRVYGKPMILAAPVMGMLAALKLMGPPLPNLAVLGAVMVAQSGIYYVGALYWCFAPDHRREIVGLARQMLRVS